MSFSPPLYLPGGKALIRGGKFHKRAYLCCCGDPCPSGFTCDLNGGSSEPFAGSGNSPILYSADFVVDRNRVSKITFNGSLDDIAVLIRSVDTIGFVELTGSMTMTWTFPPIYLMSAPTFGSISQFSTYTRTFEVSGGTPTMTVAPNTGDITGADFDLADFNITTIPNITLEDQLDPLTDPDGKARLKFAYIPSGSGFLKVDSVVCTLK